MSSKTQLANASFSLLGIEATLNVDDDQGDEAIAFRGLYDITRLEVLRATSWRFAMRTAELPESTSTAGIGFTKAYQLPTNPKCLQVVKIKLEADESWSRYGEEIHANRAPTIDYVADVGVAEFDATATSALMYLIASRLAIPLKGSSTTGERYFMMYKDTMIEARQSNSQERGRPDNSRLSLTNARFNGIR